MFLIQLSFHFAEWGWVKKAKYILWSGTIQMDQTAKLTYESFRQNVLLHEWILFYFTFITYQTCLFPVIYADIPLFLQLFSMG